MEMIVITVIFIFIVSFLFTTVIGKIFYNHKQRFSLSEKDIESIKLLILNGDNRLNIQYFKDLNDEIIEYITYKKYPEQDFITFKKNCRDINEYLKIHKLDDKDISIDVEKIIRTFQKNLIIINSHSKEKYIEHKLNVAKEILDNISGYSLDKEQRNAVVCDATRTLVVAGAGSGKTLTITGKVKYLVEHMKVMPNKILLITFTKKASEEMKYRIKEKLGVDVSVKTFHSLGYDIIGDYENKKPDVLDQKNKFNEILLEYIEKNPRVFRFLLEYFAYFEIDFINVEDFENEGDYYEELKRQNMKTLKDMVKENNEKNVTYNGERVKSHGELLIANYFFINGIEYNYEKSYEIDVSDAKHRTYKPDFYLPDYGIYLEHFGIDRNNSGPGSSELDKRKYLEDMKWKREIHIVNNTILEETYLYNLQEKNLFEKLDNILMKYKIPKKPITFKDFFGKLLKNKKLNQVDNLFELFNTFLSLFKSNNYFFDDIETMISKCNSYSINSARHKRFLNIFKIYYTQYEEFLKNNGLIDFNDMINRASSLIHNNELKTDYNFDYIIIDEFQDISVSRYNLIKEIIQKSNSKLMAVGDDWQSIYRFAGSDISLFTRFNEYFGEAEIYKITNTYRNSQELIDIAGSFVMKNKEQIKKTLTSNKRYNNPIILIESVDNINAENLNQELYKQIYYILDKINKECIESSIIKDVLLLGRNNFDLNFLFEINSKVKLNSSNKGNIVFSDFKNITITFLTVHKSKGLEADETIIINNKNSKNGFPSQITSDEILDYVLKKPEKMKFAEERRLFYVALTRTKNRCFLLSYPEESNSVFLNELLSNYINIKREHYDRDEKELDPNYISKKKFELYGKPCPKCKTGKLIVKSINDTDRYTCTNYPYCTYLKTVNKSSEVKCTKCGDYLVEREGPNGIFLGCNSYPYCNYTKKISFISNLNINLSKSHSLKSEAKRLKDISDNYSFANTNMSNLESDNNDEKSNYSKTFEHDEDDKCPKCGGILVLRNGKYGKFYGCSSYPICTYTKDIRLGSDDDFEDVRNYEMNKENDDKDDSEEDHDSHKVIKYNNHMDVESCPLCGSMLIKRNGKYGEFYSCSRFPKCRYSRNI